jgi:hypothetical protein
MGISTVLFRLSTKLGSKCDYLLGNEKRAAKKNRNVNVNISL